MLPLASVSKRGPQTPHCTAPGLGLSGGEDLAVAEHLRCVTERGVAGGGWPQNLPELAGVLLQCIRELGLPSRQFSEAVIRGCVGALYTLRDIVTGSQTAALLVVTAGLFQLLQVRSKETRAQKCRPSGPAGLAEQSGRG